MNRSAPSPLPTVQLRNEADTKRLAVTIAAQLAAIDCITLQGTLGAGKTTFMRHLIQSLTSENETVISPSFMLMQEYGVTLKASDNKQPPTDSTIHHIDGYRLEEEDEIFELGIEELFETAICCIEWPEKFADFLPESHLKVNIVTESNENRTVTLEGLGVWKEKAAQIVATF